MFILRLLVLIFLVFYSYSMGQISSAGLNDFGKLISLSFLFLLPYYTSYLSSNLKFARKKTAIKYWY